MDEYHALPGRVETGARLVFSSIPEVGKAAPPPSAANVLYYYLGP